MYLDFQLIFFFHRFTGDIIERQNSSDSIMEGCCEKLAPIALHIVMTGIYFVLMLYYDPMMALIGLAIFFGNLLLMRKVSRKNIQHIKNMRRDSRKLSHMKVSGISMMEAIKASGAEVNFLERLAGYQGNFTNSNLETQKITIYMQIVPMILVGICNTLILIIGVYNIVSGKMTIGTLMAFQGFMKLFLTPIEKAITSVHMIQGIGEEIEYIEEVMNYRTDVKIDFNTPILKQDYKKLSGYVELKDISIGYNPLTAPFILEFNLKVEKGSVIAFVGESGSGKTTIAKLIAGLYKARSGVILFDNRQKEDIDRYIFTSSVAVVDQIIILFSDTVRNNITMWDETVDEETIITACKDACIHDDIISRKEGYDFSVNESGTNFSGGQRQRIEIARALVVNPAIIILDEATSALDPIIEKKIIDAIKRRGITCFIMAHRLSAIREADEIIMLEHGKEVERGTHEELIKKSGKYDMLVKSE